MSYEGVIPVIKPAHFTSHDVVARLRKILQMKRIGHTGTLDPLVTGVLPICLGKATRIVEFLQEMPKEYEAKLVLGYATDTEDSSGTIIDRQDTTHFVIDEQKLNQIFLDLTGPLEQVPPMYSAVKVNGMKLYHLARAGIEIERKIRHVTIHQLTLISISRTHEGLPTIHFRVRCSKGTYIRTLCVEIGKRLGHLATMDSLIRSESCGFRIEDCYQLDDLLKAKEEQRVERLFIPSDQALSHFPEMTISGEQTFKALTGQKVTLDFSTDTWCNQEIIRLYDIEKHFLGLYKWDLLTKQLVPFKVWQ
jgi:tRNA pseudouridine55 synthase